MTPPRLTIRITKRRDGATVLQLTRADGTATWTRYDGPTAGFFPLHDLQHYAVETVLGHARGFYGLVADGWELSDFGTPWPRGPMPSDTDPSELIVGFFDLERASGHRASAEEYNEQMRLKLGVDSLPWPPLSDETLDRVRRRIRELHERWNALPSGETLELAFDVRQ
jgi:hypothetical protein